MHRLIQNNNRSNTTLPQNGIVFEINRQIGQIDAHKGLIGSVLNLNSLNIEHESIVLKCIFGREMKKGNLIDLFSLGRCNTHFYQIILNYIINLVSFHLSFQQSPFQEFVEGIQILMNRGLKVDNNNLMHFKNIFQNKFIEYLNNTHSDLSLVKDTIDHLMQNFDIIKNVKNQIIVEMLHTLALELTNAETPWQKKIRALDLTKAFVEQKYLQGKNKIINRFLTLANKLLDHSQEQIVNASLLIIAQLATSGLLQEVQSNVLQNLYTKLQNLLDCDDEKVATNAAITLSTLAEANLFEESKENTSMPQGTMKANDCQVNDSNQMSMTEFELFPKNRTPKSSTEKQKKKLTQSLCSVSLKLLAHEQWSKIKEGISGISFLYDNNLFHYVKTPTLEAMCLELLFILNSNKECEIDSITSIIYKLANKGFLKKISPHTIENLCLTSLNLLHNNQDDRIVIALISLLGQLGEAKLLETINLKLVEDILLNAKKLMTHKNESLVISTLATLKQIAGTDLPSLVTNLTLIESICINAKELLNHESNIVIELTLQGLGKLAKANFLMAIDKQLLWDISDKAQLFLNHSQKGIAKAAFKLLNKFVAWHLLEGLELKVIKAILENIKMLTMHSIEFQDYVMQILLSIIQNAEPFSFNEENSKIAKNICIYTQELLNTHEKEAIFALATLDLFAFPGLSQFIEPTLIQGIVNGIKHQLSDKSEDTVLYAISTMSSFVAADLTTIDPFKDALLKINDITIRQFVSVSLLNLGCNDDKTIIKGIVNISLIAELGLFQTNISDMLDAINDKANLLLENPNEKVRDLLMQMIIKLTS